MKVTHAQIVRFDCSKSAKMGKGSEQTYLTPNPSRTWLK